MMRALCTFMVLAFVMSVGAANGSEQSIWLTSVGLLEFHRKGYREALQQFDQAVTADPEDPYAIYYRGVTYGRLEDFDSAAADLRSVLELKPDLAEAALELGVALVHLDELEEAVTFLERARSGSALQAPAAFFLGIARLRLEQPAAARGHFQVAAELDQELAPAARYYQGVIDYGEGNWASAKEHFAYVAEAASDKVIGREAAAFLELVLREETDRLYRLYAGAGFEYDSNVVLSPSDEAIKTALGISDQEDGRFTVRAGGTFAPWRSRHAEVSVGYEVFQSLHLDLHELDLQDHRPSVQVVGEMGALQAGLLGRFDYYFLQDDSFLRQGTVLPWIAIKWADGRAEFFSRLRRRDFLKRPFSGVLDGFNYATGTRQVFYLGAPDRSVSIAYRFVREDPIRAEGEPFAYDGHEVGVAGGWELGARGNGEVSYTYRHERYATVSDGRRDDVHEIAVSFHRDVGDHLRLVAGYQGTVNDSNKTLFEYQRHIGSLGVEVRY